MRLGMDGKRQRKENAMEKRKQAQWTERSLLQWNLLQWNTMLQEYVLHEAFFFFNQFDAFYTLMPKTVPGI